MALCIATDCKFYLGDRPCRHRSRCVCDAYQPMGFRILIIKLGALGDVVRTACVLPTLKRLYPRSHVTWVSKPNGTRILAGHPLIDKLVVFDAEGILLLSRQSFDLVLCLDKEPAPAALCNTVSAPDKRGMGLSPSGTVIPINPECETYFELGLDDDLKFRRNTKTYPELIHQALGLEYRSEPYRLYCDESALMHASAIVSPYKAHIAGPLVGLNTGAGPVFAHKAPKPARWVEIAQSLIQKNYGILLLGGSGEREINQWIADQVGSRVLNAGSDHTESQFVAIVDQCDAVVTGDTFALHVALARQVPVVAIFGPTCHQEIELFGLGRKILADAQCAPCYRRHCEKKPACLDAIPVDRIVAAVEDVCETRLNSVLSSAV